MSTGNQNPRSSGRGAVNHPPIKAPFELPQTEAAADWHEAGKAAHTAWRACVVDELQGPTWDDLFITERLQWMNAAEAACATLSHPAAQAGAVQAVPGNLMTLWRSSAAERSDLPGALAFQVEKFANAVAAHALAATQPSAAPGDGRGAVTVSREAYDEAVAAMNKARDVLHTVFGMGRKVGPIYSHANGAAWGISNALKLLQPLAAPGAAIAAREQVSMAMPVVGTAPCHQRAIYDAPTSQPNAAAQEKQAGGDAQGGMS